MSKKFLRKRQVAERYGFHERSIDRWVAEGKFPRPIHRGRWPLWDESELDAADRALAKRDQHTTAA